jgi:hypothetical protein
LRYFFAQTGHLPNNQPSNISVVGTKTPSMYLNPLKMTRLHTPASKCGLAAVLPKTFQSIKHENSPTYVPLSGTNNTNRNLLYGVVKAEDSTSATLTGFNLAMANLNFDFQIADGIRVCLENYMSARHHSEFWVKGGYIQIDKLPMLGNPKWFEKYLRVKIGHFQPNFGDMQFRRHGRWQCLVQPIC